jgi:hypothetical protein
MNIDESHLVRVCKFGGGAACCAYILGGAKGFECGKLIPSAKSQIDHRQRLGTMSAKGDNCPGYGQKVQ